MVPKQARQPTGNGGNARPARIQLTSDPGSKSMLLPDFGFPPSFPPKTMIPLLERYFALEEGFKQDPRTDSKSRLSSGIAVCLEPVMSCEVTEQKTYILARIGPAIFLDDGPVLKGATFHPPSVRVQFQKFSSDVEERVLGESSLPMTYILTVTPEPILEARAKKRLLAEVMPVEFIEQLRAIFSADTTAAFSDSLNSSKVNKLLDGVWALPWNSFMAAASDLLKSLGLYEERKTPELLSRILNEQPEDDLGVRLLNASEVHLVISYDSLN